MADPYRPMMSPQQPEQAPQAPAGGLASRAIGGLSTFLKDVNKGIDVVRSNPLYGMAWSGLVSGMTGDPTAGPRALDMIRQSTLDAQLKQAEIDRSKQPSLTDEINFYRLRDLRRAEDASAKEQARQERLRAAVGSGDARSIEEAYRTAYPDEYAKQKLGYAGQQSSGLKAVMTPEGPRYVTTQEAIGKEPVPRAPLVSIGDQQLNPYQTSQTRAHYIAEHKKESEPYVLTTSRLQQLDQILKNLGDAEPDAFQSEAAATAFSKGLKPNEAVMRDDIARILGQGFANQLRGWANLPQKASRAQIQQMRDALATIAEIARYQQQAIDERYRALGSDYEVEIPTYTPRGLTPEEARAEGLE